MQKRALLSVSDKKGIVEFAKGLLKHDFQILSTGGTAKVLIEAGVPVTPVEEITKFPECFSGRVKTMHPLLMGGLLFRRDDSEHQAQAKELGVEPIDLVCVNLYPFTSDQQIEQIDIGGPTILRSAAKNYASVTAVCDGADYDRVLADITQHGSVSDTLRKELAAKVFQHTAAYDAAITTWLSDGVHGGISLTNGRVLRYGENPHQWGKFFCTSNADFCLPHQYQGKELSYLNILDADGAWRAVRAFREPTAVFVKHANPSGIASHASIEEAFQRAYDADRLSAFGVIIAINRSCTKAIAEKILEQKIFVEVLLAPSYASEALTLLAQKKNVRVLEEPSMSEPLSSATLYRSAFGGVLAQDDDLAEIAASDLTVVTSKKPSASQIEDLLFAWKAVKFTKSNAIVFVKDQITVGIGAGQTSRVDATWIAAKRAGERAKGAVMASDAFFPFPDSVEEAAKNGIDAIIQPGGSIRDAEVFARAEELGIVMVTTGKRCFRH